MNVSAIQRPGGFAVTYEGDRTDLFGTESQALAALGTAPCIPEDRHDLTHLPITSTDPVTAARQVIATRSAMLVDGILLDAFTASAIVAVADALSPATLAKLQALPLVKAANVCMKIVSRG